MNFWGSSYRYHKKTKQILKLQAKYKNMGDEELRHQTVIFRQRLEKGATLRSLLVEAYAVACEATERVLQMRPFPVQVLGAVAMEYNNIVEMKTGEGKTLTAAMPMYLHGLTGSGNFLITANGYLANRDAEQMGKVYRWLGLTIASGVPAPGHDGEDRDRKQIYRSDIVYTTNTSLGFDYLFDNLASNPEEQYLRHLNFALIDEADAILLDSAQTPLIIAGIPRVHSNYYKSAERMITMLEEKEDYKLSDDRKSVWFTPEGIARMQHFFGVDDLLGKKWYELYRHLVLALKAHFVYKRDRDYVVDHDEVLLVDRDNGRELIGMKIQGGQHQAIEAKEYVKITDEMRTMASVTYQNLFRMFGKLAGMTGTAATDSAEFMEVYRLAVFQVPTNKPMIRKDLPDERYIAQTPKLIASLKTVHQAYEAKRPILIETGSLSLSNLYSRLLLREKIPHSLLNARSASKEARIVAEAGQLGAVIVATSMAGRGTDIKLGEGVKEKGGLLVLGTERMANRRVDNQLRGRAGRQGEPVLQTDSGTPINFIATSTNPDQTTVKGTASATLGGLGPLTVQRGENFTIKPPALTGVQYPSTPQFDWVIYKDRSGTRYTPTADEHLTTNTDTLNWQNVQAPQEKLYYQLIVSFTNNGKTSHWYTNIAPLTITATNPELHAVPNLQFALSPGTNPTIADFYKASGVMMQYAPSKMVNTANWDGNNASVLAITSGGSQWRLNVQFSPFKNMTTQRNLGGSSGGTAAFSLHFADGTTMAAKDDSQPVTLYNGATQNVTTTTSTDTSLNIPQTASIQPGTYQSTATWTLVKAP